MNELAAGTKPSPCYHLDLLSSVLWLKQLRLSSSLVLLAVAAGAFGKVFFGMYNNDDVAVKLMNIPANISPKELEDLKSSFLQEIGVWHKLSHPNVVQVRHLPLCVKSFHNTSIGWSRRLRLAITRTTWGLAVLLVI